MNNTKLMRRLLYIAVPIFLISLAWFVSLVKDKILPEKPVHYHAGFIVIKDNQQVSFSDQKYMSIKPCVLDKAKNHEDSEEDTQREKAHLHDSIGDVVHVEARGAKWKDLFTNITYDLNYAEVEAYINGKKVTNFQDSTIWPYDSLVAFVGNGNNVNNFLSRAVTKKHIQEVASKSEDCGES
ncbi:MAG: hypothetical protein Q8Q49_01435 [bacterium]|nr:hypothetical protein [bacterium]